MRKPNASKKTPVSTNTADADEKVQPGKQLAFWLVKSGTAKKIGKKAEGSIGYQILSDVGRYNLFIVITANASGGYFSRERVPFNRVQQCLDARAPDKPFPSKLFTAAFVGRSSNNAGFLTAILYAEGLLALAPDTETQHVAAGDWTQWQTAMLAAPGKRVEIDVNPPDKKPDSNSQAESTSTSASLHSDDAEAADTEE